MPLDTGTQVLNTAHRCFQLLQVTPLGQTLVTHTLTNEHIKAYSKFTINKVSLINLVYFIEVFW